MKTSKKKAIISIVSIVVVLILVIGLVFYFPLSPKRAIGVWVSVHPVYLDYYKCEANSTLIIHSTFKATEKLTNAKTGEILKEEQGKPWSIEGNRLLIQEEAQTEFAKMMEAQGQPPARTSYKYILGKLYSGVWKLAKTE